MISSMIMYILLFLSLYFEVFMLITYIEKRKIINTVKRHNNNPERVSLLIDEVNSSGGINYAREKMIEYRNKAISILSEFPDSEAKTSMEQLVIYTTERNK